MRPFERREAGADSYYKLATWEPRSFTWKDGKVAYPTEDQARGAASKPGQYRISRVGHGGRADFEAFTVGG